MTPCIILLTCSDMDEASYLTTYLLNKNLIACAKASDVHSNFIWQGKLDNDQEVLLIMETAVEKFEEIEEEINEIHSYEQPSMFAIPVIKTNASTEKWLNDSLDKE